VSADPSAFDLLVTMVTDIKATLDRLVDQGLQHRVVVLEDSIKEMRISASWWRRHWAGACTGVVAGVATGWLRSKGVSP